MQCRARCLLWGTEWEAPLSAYRGVLVEGRRGGENNPVYRVVLKHEERRRRDVVLYQSPSREMLRARLEECSRLLGVPALSKTEEGLVARAPEDLDKSVRRRVAEGRLEAAFDPRSGPPGRHLSVSIEGDALRLRSRAWGPLAPLTAVILLFGVSALAGRPANIPYLRAVPTDLIAFSLAGGLLGLGWTLLVYEELLVSPREVRGRFRTPWGSFSEKALPAEEVEEVYAGRLPEGSSPARVHAVADSGVVSFGIGLSKAQGKWVRDCVIAIVSG